MTYDQIVDEFKRTAASDGCEDGQFLRGRASGYMSCAVAMEDNRSTVMAREARLERIIRRLIEVTDGDVPIAENEAAWHVAIDAVKERP